MSTFIQVLQPLAFHVYNQILFTLTFSGRSNAEQKMFSTTTRFISFWLHRGSSTPGNKCSQAEMKSSSMKMAALPVTRLTARINLKDVNLTSERLEPPGGSLKLCLQQECTKLHESSEHDDVSRITSAPKPRIPCQQPNSCVYLRLSLQILCRKKQMMMMMMFLSSDDYTRGELSFFYLERRSSSQADIKRKLGEMAALPVIIINDSENE